MFPDRQNLCFCSVMASLSGSYSLKEKTNEENKSTFWGHVFSLILQVGNDRNCLIVFSGWTKQLNCQKE